MLYKKFRIENECATARKKLSFIKQQYNDCKVSISHITSKLQYVKETYQQDLERLQLAHQQAKQRANDQVEHKRKNIKEQINELKAKFKEAERKENQTYTRLSWSDCCYYEEPVRCKHAPFYYAAKSYRIHIQQKLNVTVELYHAVRTEYIDDTHIHAYALEMQSKEREVERILEKAKGKLSNLESEQKLAESILNFKLFDLEKIDIDIKTFHSGEWRDIENLTILEQARREAEERVNLLINEKVEIENTLWFEQGELERFRMDMEYEIELLSQKLHEPINDRIVDKELERLAYKELSAMGLFRSPQVKFTQCEGSKKVADDQDLEYLARKELAIEKEEQEQQKGYGFFDHAPDIVGHAAAHIAGHVVGHTLAGGIGKVIGGGIGAALYPTSLGRDDLPLTESEAKGCRTIRELRQEGAQISDEKISQAVRDQLKP